MLRRELTDVDKDFKAFMTNEVKPLVPQVSEIEDSDEPDPIALHCAASDGRDCNSAAATATERD